MNTNRNPGINPYIIGTPIRGDNTDWIFGRKDVFIFIRDSLDQDATRILLHGQRRIGKSSVLQQIPQQITGDECLFFQIDFQDESQTSIDRLIHKITSVIAETLEDLGYPKIDFPSVEALETGLEDSWLQFIKEFRKLIDTKKVVLLVDEFDVLNEANSPIKNNFELYRKLDDMLSRDERLCMISVCGRNIDELENIFSLFKAAPVHEISFMEPEIAISTITRPVQGNIEYQEDAIQAILELSAGHPYFIQLICHSIFTQARRDYSQSITKKM
jgi:hypothetical protein